MRCSTLHVARPWAARVSRLGSSSLSNTKQAHAVIGRLELLRTLVAEFGVCAESGLEVPEVLNFTCPLCEAASGAARDAAVGLALDLRAIDPPRVDALIDDIKPSVTALIRARLAPADPKTISGLSVSGRKLPPIGASYAASGTGDEVNEFSGTPPGYDARARARATASELGARAPPIASKKRAGLGPRRRWSARVMLVGRGKLARRQCRRLELWAVRGGEAHGGDPRRHQVKVADARSPQACGLFVS